MHGKRKCQRVTDAAFRIQHEYRATNTGMPQTHRHKRAPKHGTSGAGLDDDLCDLNDGALVSIAAEKQQDTDDK